MTESKFIIDITESDFQTDVIEQSYKTLVLVDFWAGWCNPCKILIPLLSKLAEEYDGKFLLAKVDSEQEKPLTEQHGVRSLPTVKIYKHGSVIEEFNGVIPESAIRTLLDENIFNSEDFKYQDALDAVEQERISDAISILESILENNDSHIKSILLLAKLQLRTGNINLVDELLSHVTINKMDDPEFREIHLLNEFAREVSDAPDFNVIKNSSENSLENRYFLACYYSLHAEFEEALSLFLGIIEDDRTFRNDAPRKNMKAIFELLGSSGPLVNTYRSKLSRLLH